MHSIRGMPVAKIPAVEGLKHPSPAKTIEEQYNEHDFSRVDYVACDIEPVPSTVLPGFIVPTSLPYHAH